MFMVDSTKTPDLNWIFDILMLLLYTYLTRFKCYKSFMNN